MSHRAHRALRFAARAAASFQPTHALRFLAGLALLAAPASAQVKLSQVFGGGGNVGSMFLSDYVELYNPGPAQSLSGWSVQYASSTGTTWTVTNLPAVTLGTGQYLLIKQVDGTTLPAGQSISLPANDASGTTAITATDAKLALVSSTTALVGGLPTYASTPSLVDFVGFGTLANWNDAAAAGGIFAAAGNAPPGSNTNALLRLGCGGQDTNNSVGDWAAALPQPRSLATALNGGLTGGTLVQPFYAEENQSVRLVAQPYLCGTLLGSPGTVVTADLTAIGGSATATLLDDGTGGDEFAGDGLFSMSATIAAGTAAGSKNMPVSFNDGVNSGAVYFSLQVLPASAPNNDNCAFATAIAGPYTTPVQVADNYTGSTVEYNLTQGTPSMSNRRGLWYSVVGTGSSLTVDTCASPLNGTAIPDTMIQVFGGSCDNMMIVGYNDDVAALCGVGTGTERRSRVTWCSQAGSTYYVWVGPFSTGAQTFSIVLTVSDDGVACATAAPTTTCAPTLSGGTFEDEPAYGVANNDGCDSSPNLFESAVPSFPAARYLGNARGFSANRDVDWYRFQAATTDTLTATVRAQFNGIIEIRQLSATGTCATNTLLVQSPITVRCLSTSINTLVTAGNWYGVRVIPLNNQYPGGSAGATFGGIVPGPFNYHYVLDLETGAAPINDNCAAALTLTGAAVGANLANATNDGTSSCDPSGKDVWYTFTGPGDSGTLSLNTCGASTDTVISVYDACGGNLLVCNDDATGTPCSGPASALSMVLAPNQSVKIRVSDKGFGGAVTMNWTFLVPPPANDECTGATVISGNGPFAYDNRFATPLTATAPASTCQSSQSKDIWFQWTSQGAGPVQVDTCGGPTWDSVITVYTGTCGSLVQVVCDDDTCTTPNLASQASFTAECATVYYIRISSFSTGIGVAGAFNLTAPGFIDTDGDGTQDCADGCPNDPLKVAPGACGCGTPDTDTDGDGTPDCFDGCPEDPLKTEAGACGCGTPDTDTDGDGTPDCLDSCPLDPLKVAPGACGCGTPDTDTDGDGTPDCIDGCPGDPLKTSPGTCGCGIPDTDTDGDGTPDCFDSCPEDPLKTSPGACGCGIPDTDTDGDGTPDCIDGCPDDPNKQAAGLCGCGVPETDTDSDGWPDCIDNCPGISNPGQEDVDGDGIGDLCDNCPDHPNAGQADCDGNGVGDTCEIAGGTWPDCNANGVPDNCEVDCNANGIPDECDINAATSFDLDLNGIPDECETTQGVLFCFGDGSGTTCPCGNAGLPDEGCANSTGRGAKLYNAGSTSVFLDNAAPLTVQLPPDKPLIFIGGTSTQNGGSGVVFYDGLLCVTAARRFPAQMSSSTGTAVLTQPVFKSGNTILPGSTWYFQTWFRDGVGSPCGTRVNLSNGLGITFTP